MAGGCSHPSRCTRSPTTSTGSANSPRVAPPRSPRSNAAGSAARAAPRFPAAVKLTAVGSRRRAVVIANGSEGEPASLKDTVLMTRTPHLVLDGAVLAAEIVGAREVIMCVKRGSPAQPILQRADRGAAVVRIRHRVDPYRRRPAPLRRGRGDRDRQLAQRRRREAHVHSPRPFERGVDGRPTLVQNVETLCDMALIGRFGSDWYRSAGTADDPGTTLVTLSGGVERPGVYEIPLGARLSDVVSMAGATAADLSAILVGGYFGAWIPAAEAARTQLGVAAMQRAGGGLGAGILYAMPREGACGLAESARVARWLADENAGQCGPCVNGLDAIARAMAALVAGDADRRAEKKLTQWLSQMNGRGACKHPDGAARFVASSLGAFSEEIERHRRHGACRNERDATDAHAAPGRLAMSFRLVVNPITCVAHGMCAELFPERITLDDWGYPIIDPDADTAGPRGPRPAGRRRVPHARAHPRGSTEPGQSPVVTRDGGGDGDPPPPPFTRTAFRPRRLLQQFEDRLRGGVGLGEHGGAGLQEDLVLGEVDHFEGHVGVHDLGFGC